MAETLVEIGGWPVSIRLAGRQARLETSYRPFITPSAKTPSAHWKVKRVPFPSRFCKPPPAEPPPFPLWEIERCRGRVLFRFRKRLDAPDLWKTALMDYRLSRGEIWTDGSTDTLLHPLRCLDQLLFAHFLLPRGGLLIHAAAAALGGEAYLFPAPAGSGKSTWAGLLHRDPAWTVIADDKVVLRKTGNDYRVFGTPWNADREFQINDSAPLKGICFLEHGRVNSIQPLRRAETIRWLLQQTFLPFPEAGDIDKALSILESVTAGTAAFRFGFRPDQGAAEYFLTAIEKRTGDA